MNIDSYIGFHNNTFYSSGTKKYNPMFEVFLLWILWESIFLRSFKFYMKSKRNPRAPYWWWYPNIIYKNLQRASKIFRHQNLTTCIVFLPPLSIYHFCRKNPQSIHLTPFFICWVKYHGFRSYIILYLVPYLSYTTLAFNIA